MGLRPYLTAHAFCFPPTHPSWRAPAICARIRNLGILAHVDAGKTTLTEGLLFRSGATRSAGQVDKGTSLSDTLDVERRRGISVRASSLSFVWQDVRFQLIDTPGHVDFSAEVERSLQVLDAAVLVVSAVEGIQTQTETIWRALQARGLPVLVFINKIDRMGADAAGVLAQMQADLSPDLVGLNRAVGIDDEAVSADLSPAAQAALVEAVAATNDALLEAWIAADGHLPEVEWRAGLAGAVGLRRLFPVVCGSAKTGTGIDDVLDAMVRYLPDAPAATEDPLSAVVFRLEHDQKLGRIAGVRLFAGRLRTRDRVINATAGREEQITQIKTPALGRFEDAAELTAGDIGFLCGMPEIRIGDILGDDTAVPGGPRLTTPLLSVQVMPDRQQDIEPLAAALQQLSSEDPHLDFRWFSQERELQLRIMGVVQTEILTELLLSRFGLAAQFSPPIVIYQETPAKAGEGAESYTMPKPCWAIVKFHIEPAAPGSGVTYRSLVGKSDIHPKYQNEIAARIEHALGQGPKGWQATDLTVTLVEGNHHLLHSRPGDFKLATDMALLKALTETDTILLEPMLSFRISAPEPLLGKITGDVVHMRGVFEPAEVTSGQFVLRGRIPLATSMDYAIRLGSISAGRGALSTEFDGYEPCPPGTGVTRDFKGISPLERAKYILWWRGAITTAQSG